MILDCTSYKNFNSSALWLRELGITQREHFKVYTKKPTCDHKGQFGSVGLIDCRMAMEILLYGFLISFVVLAIEKLLMKAKCNRGEFN